MVRKWKKEGENDTGRSTVTERSLRTPARSLPKPQHRQERAGATRGCAWRRAGVKWVETMSFVAEAGGGEGGTGEKIPDREGKKKRD